ncbi:hypothetical protein JOC36_000918 [Weissella uvarum]|uniref:hypothetical protein n=1 Tax=Weissella uvarum TaxID=1479233 RepID=UPI00203051AD|nr:hypothetical protein [Weissella uvarum]MBM7617361.1 hypothetical protein [Weissella uvarum]MCM0595752.1 hypothetical protein [Weissella uvarum]
MVDESGSEQTYLVNPWSLPSFIPNMLDELIVESVVYQPDELYPTVNLEMKQQLSFDEQATVIQVWQAYRERLRRKAVVGASIITDGEFHD